jgi:hypothetical protein
MNKLPLYTYLFLFDEEVGSYERVRRFIDSRPEIVNWHGYFSNAFLIVSHYTAGSLSELILKHLTKRRGRFLILDTNTDRSGWMPKTAWDLMRTPHSVWEYEMRQQSGREDET